MEMVLIIPARYASSRFPGKPLVKISGQTMIYRTWRRCAEAFPREHIYVATDDERIADHCREQGMNALMTSDQCLTGTDRLAEASRQLRADVVINVQGDEPILNPNDLEEMVRVALHCPDEILNGVARVDREELYRSPNIPKVVMRPDGRLLYMSRAPIPANKDNQFIAAWRQICIYVFPQEALEAFGARADKSQLEKIEDIEILRFLEMGYEVRMVPVSGESIAVDTPEDIARVEAIIEDRGW